MPDEMNLDGDTEETEATPPIVHDDIMHRLLDYQRQLREGMTPEQAAQHAAVLVDYSALDASPPVAEPTDIEVLDLATAEEAEEPGDGVPQAWSVSRITSEPMPTPPVPAADASGDLAVRIAKLEDTLSNIGTSISELRGQFQNLALAADERLAAIESMLTDAVAS